MEEQATSDFLTGLLNRRAILALLEVEWGRSQRHAHPLAVLGLDIDGFKWTNDSHGHAAGDRAIRAVADALRGTIRREDFAGRIGGDEFLVILPETEREGALQTAE